jgi:hypothetical protein
MGLVRFYDSRTAKCGPAYRTYIIDHTYVYPEATYVKQFHASDKMTSSISTDSVQILPAMTSTTESTEPVHFPSSAFDFKPRKIIANALQLNFT